MSHQAQPKYTKRLIPTAQKQQQKRDAKAAEQTDNHGDVGRVSRRSTGERITFGNALADIRRALEKHPGAPTPLVVGRSNTNPNLLDALPEKDARVYVSVTGRVIY